MSCVWFSIQIFISQNVPSPLWSRLRLSGRSCLHFVKPSTWPCWPEPMCTIACFRGTKVSGLRKGLHPARLFLLISSGVHCFTKSHTNCPFLPSFLSVQWHVMGTILGVNTDFHFSKCSNSCMEQPEIVALDNPAPRPQLPISLLLQLLAPHYRLDSHFRSILWLGAFSHILSAKALDACLQVVVVHPHGHAMGTRPECPRKRGRQWIWACGRVPTHPAPVLCGSPGMKGVFECRARCVG